MLLSGQASDRALIAAVLEGQTDRFAGLVDRYQNLVYSTVLAGGISTDEAEDVVQETFFRAYRNLGALENPASFGGWLRRIASNLAQDSRREADRRRRGRQEHVTPFPGPPSPAQVAEAQDEHERIWGAMKLLTPELREVLLLRYMEGCSLSSIAVYLDTSRSLIKRRLHMAREKIRDLLDERRTRSALRGRKLDKEFRKRVMSALPLVPVAWRTTEAAVRWHWLGWGAAGAALVWLVGVHYGENPRSESDTPRVRTRLTSPVEYDRLQDQIRFPRKLESTSSVFGTPELPDAARERQDQALGRDDGGQVVWDFSTGDQGWRARDAKYSSPQYFLPAEARDGVLHVPLGAPGPRRVPSVELVSPEIGYDAGVFSGLEVRARLIHGKPLPGRFSITWTTPANRLLPGRDPFGERLAEERRRTGIDSLQVAWVNRFWNWMSDPVMYGTDWQDLRLDPLNQRPETDWGDPKVVAPPACWEGELVDLRLTFLLADLRRREEISPGDFPVALEIDRIALVGPGPRRVDLPPTSVVAAPTPGLWMQPSGLQPLRQRGIREGWPVLGDVDGDGDVDLVVDYSLGSGYTKPEIGWVTALNDGSGRFRQHAVQGLEGSEGSINVLRTLLGVDVDGDTQMDLVVGKLRSTRVFLGNGQGRFRQSVAWENHGLIGVTDVDADGDADIVTRPYVETGADLPPAERTWTIKLQLNQGGGRFVSERSATPLIAGAYPHALGDLDGDGQAELLWLGSWDPTAGRRDLYVDSGCVGGHWRERTALSLPPPPASVEGSGWPTPTYLGDLDHDGVVEVGTPLGILRDNWVNVDLGMELYPARGGSIPQPWLPRSVHLRNASLRRRCPLTQTWDLNRDGWTDAAWVDVNYRRGASLLVLRGQARGYPVEEGRYPLPNESYGWACGDVDGDGDTDVVVVVENGEQAGLCLVRNVVGEAVEATAKGRQ